MKKKSKNKAENIDKGDEKLLLYDVIHSVLCEKKII